MNERIKQLLTEIDNERLKMDQCHHDFGQPFYNPDSEKQPTGYETVGQGSDVWTQVTGWKDVDIPRWTRVCTVCGFEQHTTEQEPIITGHQPKFK
jgi:hypothetical protein